MAWQSPSPTTLLRTQESKSQLSLQLDPPLPPMTPAWSMALL